VPAGEFGGIVGLGKGRRAQPEVAARASRSCGSRRHGQRRTGGKRGLEKSPAVNQSDAHGKPPSSPLVTAYHDA